MSSKKKAIIIGGSISGKLAARVLSDFFEEVVILERDQEPKGPSPRKGTRQDEHIHALLLAGHFGLEELFPGISEKFYSSGAVKINSTKDLAWFHHGVWKLRFDGEYTTILQSRPHLEWHIQQYIKKIPNVSTHYNKVVENYLYSVEENRVYGVKIKTQNNSVNTLTADLIVDASGASSFTSSWLQKLGITIPTEKVQIGLSYFSKSFHLPDSKSRDWKIKIIYPNPPHEKIGGSISKVEGEQYLVTLIGYQNQIQDKEIFKNNNDFLELAKRLPKLDIFNEIKDGTPLSQTAIYRVPEITWKRFDKVKQLPKGLLLIGDSVCRIDPVFGQGMSIAVLEALTLQKLFSNKNCSLQNISALFHKNISRIIAPIWNMVITEDFRYPGISGKKPFGLKILQWYTKNIFILSSQNKKIYETFIQVMHLVKPTTILLHPKVIKIILVRAFLNR